MNENSHSEMIAVQDRHWWFIARRELVDSVITRFVKFSTPKPSILEVGCGSGGNFEILKRIGSVTGVEPSSLAFDFARKKIRPGQDSLFQETAEGFLINSSLKWDLICAFDVLEHIEDDYQVLLLINRAMRDKGFFILTVPAHQFLFGPHDVFLSHYRRYSPRRLIELLHKAGFRVIYHRAWMSFLFAPFAIVRFLQRLSNKSALKYSPPGIPNRFFNFILIWTHRVERFVNYHLHIKVGASIVIACVKSR